MVVPSSQATSISMDGRLRIAIFIDFLGQRVFHPQRMAMKSVPCVDMSMDISIITTTLVTCSVAQIIYPFIPHLSIYIPIATNMLYNDAFMINSLVMLVNLTITRSVSGSLSFCA
jgi:hypothetical protein